MRHYMKINSTLRTIVALVTGLTFKIVLMSCVNQFGKTFSFNKTTGVSSGRGDALNFGVGIKFNWEYIKNNWYPSNFSGFSDDPRDSHMIREDYNK